jgi:hypothetical protein
MKFEIFEKAIVQVAPGPAVILRAKEAPASGEYGIGVKRVPSQRTNVPTGGPDGFPGLGGSQGAN